MYDHTLKLMKQFKWVKFWLHLGQLENTSLIKEVGISHVNSKEGTVKAYKAQLDSL